MSTDPWLRKAAKAIKKTVRHPGNSGARPKWFNDPKAREAFLRFHADPNYGLGEVARDLGLRDKPAASIVMQRMRAKVRKLSGRNR